MNGSAREDLVNFIEKLNFKDKYTKKLVLRMRFGEFSVGYLRVLLNLIRICENVKEINIKFSFPSKSEINSYF
jgi:hypothetical protein